MATITPTPEQYANREIIVSTESNLVTLYEVTTLEGIAIWGGSDASDAIFWLRRSPAGSRLIVSLWDEDGEDAWKVGEFVDITGVAAAALAVAHG